jgi:predicted restriction endonuclease
VPGNRRPSDRIHRVYEQRLDVHNGLLLSALWDAAFDKGLISFGDDGKGIAGAQLSELVPLVWIPPHLFAVYATSTGPT